MALSSHGPSLSRARQPTGPRSKAGPALRAGQWSSEVCDIQGLGSGLPQSPRGRPVRQTVPASRRGLSRARRLSTTEKERSLHTKVTGWSPAPSRHHGSDRLSRHLRRGPAAGALMGGDWGQEEDDCPSPFVALGCQQPLQSAVGTHLPTGRAGERGSLTPSARPAASSRDSAGRKAGRGQSPVHALVPRILREMVQNPRAPQHPAWRGQNSEPTRQVTEGTRTPALRHCCGLHGGPGDTPTWSP